MNNIIKIRPIEIHDIDKLHKWRNEKAIFDNLGGGYIPRSKSQMTKWMDAFVENGESVQRYMICLNTNAVGYLSLDEINYKNGTCELGIYIGEEEARGKGVAKTAINIIKKYAKESLNLRKIKLKLLAENYSALKLYESTGFEIVGKYNNERYVNGEYKDLLIMEVFL